MNELPFNNETRYERATRATGRFTRSRELMTSKYTSGEGRVSSTRVKPPPRGDGGGVWRVVARATTLWRMFH